MAIYWPTPGFKGRNFKLFVLNRWDFNFCVRSSPLQETSLERMHSWTKVKLSYIVDACVSLQLPPLCSSTARSSSKSLSLKSRTPRRRRSRCGSGPCTPTVCCSWPRRTRRRTGWSCTWRTGSSTWGLTWAPAKRWVDAALWTRGKRR